ncbi:MAG: helix-turn-helix domain-containing protein [Hyphomicrobiales bacterium]|nr:helix-turn-helix domain-containing protein [Hyphomicrobiales bacterium]
MSKPHLRSETPNCRAIRDLLSTVGSKWTVVLIELLAERPKRFSELKREVGEITQKSLTTVLRELERGGIVRRTVTPIIPPRVDYELTPLGVSLSQSLAVLINWAIENETSVSAARQRFADTTGQTAGPASTPS